MFPQLQQQGPQQPTNGQPGVHPPVGQPAEQLTKEDLLSMFRDPLKALINSDVRGDVDKEKIYQYAEARKAELYDRGLQFVAPDIINGQIVDFSSVTGSLKSLKSTDVQQNSVYDYVINDIRGYRRKFVAVLGSRAPNAKASPNDHDNEDHVRRSRIADTLIERLRSIWKVETAHRQLALGFWKSGTVFFYTPFVANAEKYGQTEEPVLEMRATPIGPATLSCVQCGAITPVPHDQLPPIACPQCGSPFGPEDYHEAEMMDVPEVVDIKSYPNGCSELHLCSVFTVTTPFWVENLTRSPWLWYEYEEHKGVLLKAHPQLRDLIGNSEGLESGGGATSSQGTLARATTASPTGLFIPPRKNRWMYSRFWLAPPMFELLKSDQLRQLALQYFPTGMKVTMVQDKVVDVEHERLDHVWAMAKPETSETIYADPTCKDFMPVQDLINDMHNITVQTYERAIPQTLVPVDIIDMQQIRKRSGVPGEYVPIMPGVGNIRDRISQMPVAKPEPSVQPWIESLREHAAENIGITRALFGGQLPDETAHGAEIRKNQSMMQLNTPWQEARSGWRDAYRNGIIQMVQNSGGRVPVPNATTPAVEQMDLEDLMQGGWHIEIEETMPMSWGERRDWVMNTLQKVPPEMLVPMLGLDMPDNIPVMQESTGLTGWKVPNLDAREKVQATIRQLLQGQPVEQPQPQPDGSVQPQLMPSIPADEFEDNHPFCVSEVQAWAQTDKGRDARAKNPGGYSNVIAWGKMHLQMAQPPPVMPGPGGPAGPGPGPEAGPGPGGPPPPGGPVGPAGPGPAGPPPNLAAKSLPPGQPADQRFA